jgi:diguanylate cyclase (GGDEF)-like protein/PAS domain S-box-containing protein
VAGARAVGATSVTAPSAARTVLLIANRAADAGLVMSALDDPLGRFRLRWVTSVEAALATLAYSHFECLVLDLGWPDSDALEVVEALREKAGDTAIVVLTGGTDDGLGLRAIQSGANDYLRKDQLSAWQLQRSITHAVERAHSVGAARRSAAVLAALSDGILVVDCDGRVVSVNPAAERLLGLAGAELVGSPLPEPPWSITNRDGTPLPDHTRPALETLASGKALHGMIASVRGAGGDVSWIELSTNPLYAPEGRIDGVVASLRDISERHNAEEETRFHAALLAAVGQAVIVTDPRGRIVFWNSAAETMYGWTAAEALGLLAVDLVPADSASQAQTMMRALVAGESWTGDFLARRRDGSRFPALLTDTPVFDDHGQLVAIIGVSTDISERKRTEEAAQNLSAIVESTADAIFTTAVDGTILTWNRGAEQLYGFSAQDVVGRHVALLQPIEVQAEARSVLATVVAGGTVRGLETVRYRRDRTSVDVSLTVSPVFGEDGSVVAASAIARDISDRRRLEQELIRQAMHDTLTGLPNRTLLDDRLSQALAGAARRGVPVAVLFLDLDQFKTVNDASGHHTGDQLLVEVAARLRAVVRPADTVARFGGDEFVIVCEDADQAEAERVADRIGAALSDPIAVAGQRVYVSASIGIAVTPPLEPEAEALLRFADAAMYDAKAHGRAGWRVFDASLAKESAERLELTNELRDALRQDQLAVHYQPVVELATGQLIGIEALLRWQHPKRGWVPPALFVPLAEETGLVAALDRWVLARACHDVATMRSSGMIPVSARLAVNISACNIADPDLLDAVRDSAASAGFPLDLLELEVTETGLMADAPTARGALEALRELGVSIALDDFGTGYSSLTNVRHLPVNTIKIDRGFIDQITSRPDDLAIAAAVIDLARAIGMRSIAEGVETPEQLALLHRMGCSAGQGYLWSRALPRDALAALIKRKPLGFLAASGPIGSAREATNTSRDSPVTGAS